ncbi:MAG: hypothetical protein RIF32_04985 [Leptospirales bacterium]
MNQAAGQKSKLMRTTKLALAALGAFTLTAGLAVLVAASAGASLDPVQFRVYLWDNALYFLYTPAAVLLLALSRLLAANGYLNRGPGLAAAYAVAGALIVVSAIGFQIVRPEPIVWADLRGGGAVREGGDPGDAGELWLPQRVSLARAMGLREGRPVLYYLHADWCHSCEDFESYVLGSPFLREDLAPFIKVRLDVTDIHRWQDYLDRKLGVSAVPSIIVGDRAGRLIPRPVIGENVSLKAVRSVLRAGALPTPLKATVR